METRRHSYFCDHFMFTPLLYILLLEHLQLLLILEPAKK